MIKDFEKIKAEYDEVLGKLENACEGHSYKALAPALMLLYASVLKDGNHSLEKAVEGAIISIAEIYGVRTEFVDNLMKGSDVRH